MAQPDEVPVLAPVLSEHADALPPDRVARETALREVGDTILNIEAAVRRADRARKAIARAGNEPNFVLALDAAIAGLEQLRRKLHQETYFGSTQQRLI